MAMTVAPKKYNHPPANNRYREQQSKTPKHLRPNHQICRLRSKHPPVPLVKNGLCPRCAFIQKMNSNKLLTTSLIRDPTST